MIARRAREFPVLGLVLNELLDFAESQRPGHGPYLLAIAGRPDKRYEPLKRYDPHELVRLAVILAQEEAVPLADVLRGFGARLFERLSSLYPVIFGRSRSTKAFLTEFARVREELKSLHADADLPTICCRQLAGGVLELDYVSSCGLADLADGMIRGCIARFDDQLQVVRDPGVDLPRDHVRFLLTPMPP